MRASQKTYIGRAARPVAFGQFASFGAITTDLGPRPRQPPALDFQKSGPEIGPRWPARPLSENQRLARWSTAEIRWPREASPGGDSSWVFEGFASGLAVASKLPFGRRAARPLKCGCSQKAGSRRPEKRRRTSVRRTWTQWALIAPNGPYEVQGQRGTISGAGGHREPYEEALGGVLCIL